MDSKPVTIALAGSPNSGKSTLFNAITGLRQHIANYPGVTVEIKEGLASHKGDELRIIDLPGAYSLTPHSREEAVARDFILDQKPDVLISVVDSSNLERSLYLSTQLLELDVPLVLAFNMSDLAQAKGFNIDDRRLSALLGAPIVRTVGNRDQGIPELLDAAMDLHRMGTMAVGGRTRPDYGEELRPHVRQMEELLSRAGAGENVRWLAVKLLEADESAIARLRAACPDRADEICRTAAGIAGHIKKICGDSPEIIFADRRYGFISGACMEAVKLTVEARHESSDRIDAIMTNRYLGLPIFALMMLAVFQATFWLGNPLVDLLDGGKEWLADLVRNWCGAGIAGSLLADGIVEGVGAVLQFVPLIAILYVALAILEDSGYMARAAFVMDRFMHRVGLHGKSAIPMILGFGCTVPAILATRILESRRDRLVTMMVLPLMSCGARMPAYLLILGALFPSRGLVSLPGGIELTNQALILFGLYALGVIIAMTGAWLLRKTVFRGEPAAMVMELPVYRMPTLRGLVIHTSERTWQYLKKAGTVILAIVIVLWAMKTWPALPDESRTRFDRDRQTIRASPAAESEKAAALAEINRREHSTQLESSAIGRVGRFIEPAFAPCGLDWKAATAMLGALAAKEVFVSQMGVIYAVEHESDESADTLARKIAADYSRLQGLVILLFILISSPCMGTLVAVAKESGSWRWAGLQWLGLTAIAWLVATALFQSGRFLGFG